MKLVCAFLLLGVASAQWGPTQQCTCHASSSEGFWVTNASAPRGCDLCDGSVVVAAVAGCQAIDQCAASGPLADFTIEERQCYGITSCLPLTPNAPCNCSDSAYPQTTGKFCQSCPEGKIGWPDCTSDECTQLTCSSNGDCDDSDAPRACGVRWTGFSWAPLAFRPASERCYTLPEDGGQRVLPLTPEAILYGAISQVNCGTTLCAPFETCGDAQTSTCCPAKTEFCGSPTGDGDCCEAWQSCCDGTCCNLGSQACADVTSLAYSVPPPSGPDKIWSSGGGPRQDWVMDDGVKIDVKQQCTNTYVNTLSIARAFVQPATLVAAFVIGNIIMLKATGLPASPVTMKIPVMALLALSLFYCFTRFWVTGMLVLLACYCAMAASHKGGAWPLFLALVAEVYALAAVTGGTGLVSGTTSLYFTLSGNPNFNPGGQLSACYNYFGTFEANTGNFAAPDLDPALQYVGLCSEGFYFVFLCVTAAYTGFLILLTISTFAAWATKPAAAKEA